MDGGQWIARLPQEHFCQAPGLPSHLLAHGSARRPCEELFDLPAPGNAYEMAPLYDVLSVWPYVGRKRGQLHLRDVRLAMALRSKNTHYEIHTIRARHWHALAMKNGGPPVWEAMQGLVVGVAQALKSVEAQLPRDFPKRIWDPIAKGMRGQAEKFLSEAVSIL